MNDPNPAELALWHAADSLPALGECMAKWLTGDINYQPAYLASEPAEETVPHIADLAAINRAGLVTWCSQPGQLWAGGGQRAFVSGFCTYETMARLRQVLLRTDLVVLTFWPEADSPLDLAVTVHGAEEHTWVGATLGPDNLEQDYGDDLSHSGLWELLTAWQVTVVDPLWGRDDLLWPSVIHALTAEGPLPGAIAEGAPS